MVFDRFADEYDRWFDENERVYQAEISALRRMIPPVERAIEVGVGTGRFALRLGVRLGVEPSRAMAKVAQRRGLQVCQSLGEELPFAAGMFECVLLVTVICFVADPLRLLREARRVLTPGGVLVNGFIDRDSALGRVYEAHKAENKFYQEARFYSSEQVAAIMRQAGFNQLEAAQTILGLPSEGRDFDMVKTGFGEGAFVALRGRR